MPRKARIDAPDALHHIICRGYMYKTGHIEGCTVEGCRELCLLVVPGVHLATAEGLIF